MMRVGRGRGVEFRVAPSLFNSLPRKTEVFGDYEGIKSRAVLTWLEYDAHLKIEVPVIQTQH